MAFLVQVDTFLAVGELALFVALVDRRSVCSRVFPRTVTVAGLAGSVAGNIGHLRAVGLGVLKRVVAALAFSS